MKRPDFDVAFSIGSFSVYWFALLLAAGIAVMAWMTDRRARGRDLPKDIALDLCILGIPFGVLGARLFACLSGAVAWDRFFHLTYPGLSFFGGMLFSAGAMLIYLRLRRVSVSEMLDAAAPSLYTGLAIIVWGDFFNRSHYGPLVEKAAHKWFPLATFGSDLKIHYAAFFYEFLLCVLLVVLYYALIRKRINGKDKRFFLLLMLFCLGRFCIDSIRVDRAMLGPLAFDQWWELVLFLLSLFFLLRKQRPLLSPEGPTSSADDDPPAAADAPSPEVTGKETDEPDAGSATGLS